MSEPRIIPRSEYLNMWGTPKEFVNADEFCPECEQVNHLGHYASCPLKVRS